MYACIYVCMYVCMHACMHAYTHTRTHTQTDTDRQTDRHTHTHTHTHTSTAKIQHTPRHDKQKRIHTHTHTRTHTHTHTQSVCATVQLIASHFFQFFYFFGSTAVTGRGLDCFPTRLAGVAECSAVCSRKRPFSRVGLCGAREAVDLWNSTQVSVCVCVCVCIYIHYICTYMYIHT
jgi:hypothetical protein